MYTVEGWDGKNELKLWQDACRDKLWLFLLYAFGVRNFMRKNPHKAWCVEEIHRPLCDWMEERMLEWVKTRHLRTKPKKIMIIWPRGFGKTTIVTKAAQLWLHLQDPDVSTITDSVTTEKSWEFLGALKHVMDGSDPNAWFTHLYGNWRDPKREWKQGKLVHAFRQSLGAESSSMMCSSVEKGITGKHPDALFIDDPIVQEKLTEGLAWIEKVNRHMDAMIPALQSDGLLVATATRYHDTDWLGKYLRDEGCCNVEGHEPPYRDFDIRPDGQWELFFMQARGDDGKSMLPDVVSDAFLQDYERKNPMDFQAQMMNDPGTGAHMPLTLEDLDRCWVEQRDVPKNLGYSIHCDTAWKSREMMGRGDFSAIQLWGHAGDGSGVVYYLEGWDSNTWSAEEFLDTLVGIIKRLKQTQGARPFAVTDERALGGKNDIMENLIWSHCAQYGVVSPPVVLLNRGGTKKEIRIREAAGYWKNGKVKLVRGAPGVETLRTQMLRIGVSAHDDMADCAADVFNEEIYTPERVAGQALDQPMMPRRPYDEYLQMPLGKIDADGVRELYDRDVERENEVIEYLEKWGW
jgi:hypothetical protein